MIILKKQQKNPIRSSFGYVSIMKYFECGSRECMWIKQSYGTYLSTGM